MIDQNFPVEFFQGIELFNKRYFWECHEVLEDIWMDEIGDQKRFYQGLIQAAAAMYHVLDNNPRGVIRLALEAQKKLKPYHKIVGLEALTELHEKLGYYVAEAEKIEQGKEAQFDLSQLPKLTFNTAS